MDNLLTSFILGLLSTVSLFLISLILVVGTKSVYLYLKEFLFPTPVKVEKVEKPQNTPRPRKKKQTQYTPVKSIEINPDEVDRIYVRKIS